MNDSNDQSFIVDSDATSHMTNDVGKLFYIKSYNENNFIYVGNGNSLLIYHIRDICVLRNEGKLDLKDVLVFLI